MQLKIGPSEHMTFRGGGTEPLTAQRQVDGRPVGSQLPVIGCEGDVQVLEAHPSRQGVAIVDTPNGPVVVLFRDGFGLKGGGKETIGMSDYKDLPTEKNPKGNNSNYIFKESEKVKTWVIDAVMKAAARDQGRLNVSLKNKGLNTEGLFLKTITAAQTAGIIDSSEADDLHCLRCSRNYMEHVMKVHNREMDPTSVAKKRGW